MSGLEALAVFGVACNVLQVISFAHETLSSLRRFYRDGSSVDPNLLESAGKMPATFASLEKWIAGRPAPPIEHQAELLDIATRCSTIAKELCDEVQKISGNLPCGDAIPSGKRKRVLRAISLAAKRVMSKRRREELERDLGRFQNTLATGLLVYICTQQDAAYLRQDESFSQIDRRLQLFISKRADGVCDVSELIRDEAKSIKQAIEELGVATDRGHQGTREHFTKAIDKLNAVRVSEAERSKFLDSLNFDYRDKRMNEIKDAHYNTFEWLFGVSLATGTLPVRPSAYVPNAQPLDGLQQSSRDPVHESLVEQGRLETWDSFADWLRSDCSLYWISGKAGSGKSTLMKFLSNDPRTKQLLNDRRNAVLISHFFYLMGNPMQCNFKGLLCSLLYQLVLGDQDGSLLGKLSHLSNARHKKTDANWSERELEGCLFEILRQTTATQDVCIFVDGLDEIHASDGAHELLLFLDRLREIRSVRLCVSSRPEEVFKQAYKDMPSLALHHLTLADMYLFSLDLLERLAVRVADEAPGIYQLRNGRLAPRGPQRLAILVAKKSEGVFLWARLCVHSLRRGLTNGDSWLTLQGRLEEMPGDLYKLYASMWSRVNSDTAQYRSDAALYFNLVLDSLKHVNIPFAYWDCWNPRHFNRRHFPPPHGRGNLFQIAHARNQLIRLASDPTLERVEGGLDTDEQWKLCSETYDRIPILCAGLVELSGPLVKQNGADEPQLRFPDVDLTFIHRTAREFLKDTPEGREILKFDTSSFEMRYSSLVLATLRRALAFRQSREQERSEFCLPLTKISIIEILLAVQATKVRGAIQNEACHRLLEKCRLLYDGAGAGASEHFNSPLHPDFLCVAAGFGLYDYVVSKFEPDRCSFAYKSYLLLCATPPPPVLFRSPVDDDVDWEDWPGLTNHLLARGCRSSLVVVPAEPHVKLTALETFLWGIGHIVGSHLSNRVVCGRIIETLRRFIDSGADPLQPVYGFYGRRRDSKYAAHTIISGYYNNAPIVMSKPNPHDEAENMSSERSEMCILIEWTLLGILARAAHLAANTCFGELIAEFVSDVTARAVPSNAAMRPRAVALGKGHGLVEWVACGRIVCGESARRVDDAMAKWTPWSGDDYWTKARELDDELFDAYKDALAEGTGDITASLVRLGFAESRPCALSEWLEKCPSNSPSA